MRLVRRLILLLVAAPLPAAAQGLDPEALDLIATTAASICGDFASQGSASDASLEGQAEAKLKGLAGRLVDLVVEGAGRIADSEYAGVLREQLGDELKDVRACRLQVWKDLQDKLGGSPQGAVAPAPAPPGVSHQGQARPPAPPPATADLGGGWNFVTSCPNAFYGQQSFTGYLFLHPAGNGEYQGTIRNSAGAFGQVRSLVDGATLRSEILWSDSSVTSAVSRPEPDGRWIAQDSLGCTSQFYR
jgi:hypothetical protein